MNAEYSKRIPAETKDFHLPADPNNPERIPVDTILTNDSDLPTDLNNLKAKEEEIARRAQRVDEIVARLEEESKVYRDTFYIQFVI